MVFGECCALSRKGVFWALELLLKQSFAGGVASSGKTASRSALPGIPQSGALQQSRLRFSELQILACFRSVWKWHFYRAWRWRGLGVLEATFVRVVGHSGFEDAVDLMEELAHDGDDDLLWRFAVRLESVSELFEQRVIDACGHGWHEEASSEMNRSDLGDRGACPA